MSAPDISSMADKAQALVQLRQYKEAVAIYQQLVGHRPDSDVYAHKLGTTLLALSQHKKAEAAFRRTLEINPEHSDSLFNLGFIAYSQHNYTAAEKHFRKMLGLNPANPQALNALATVLQALGQYQEALMHYNMAIKISPVYVDAHFGRSGALITLGDTAGAIKSLHETIRLKPNHAGAYINLASALMTQGKHEIALEACEKALQITPRNADAVALAATIEQHAGKAEEALLRLQPWIDAGVQNINLAIAFAEVSKTLNQPDAAIDLMEQLLGQERQLPVTSQRNLHFNLGRLYDKTGQYEQAFTHYQQGNDTRPVEYTPQTNARVIDNIITIHSPAFMATAPRSHIESDKPVFIVGMPRSGTSLVEQILDSHPRVHGAGELANLWQMAERLPTLLDKKEGYPICLPSLDAVNTDTLSRQYHEYIDGLAPDAARVIDKMPGNFRFLGMIEMLFPNARIIHCVRDPRDTCLSCYFQDFSRTHAYSYNLAHLGHYYNDYQRLMDHWGKVLQLPIIDVHYENLIENQEAVSRQLVEFCGLDWDEACLNFHETRRFVATASYDQVRRPLYKKSVARWKNYEKHIGPLTDALK